MTDHTYTARRASAALGQKISPADIEFVSDNGLVQLKDGQVFSLSTGNSAYIGDGRWKRNGKDWDPHTAA